MDIDTKVPEAKGQSAAPGSGERAAGASRNGHETNGHLAGEYNGSAAVALEPAAGDGATPSEEGDLSSFQNIGQAPLLPPREPLGARIAAVMGRHHALLFGLCVALLWCITTLPSSWMGEPFQRGQSAPHDVIAPHDLIVPLLDPTEIAARKKEAASLVPPSYDPNPAAQSQALTELYAIVGASRQATVPATPAKTPVTSAALQSQRLLRLKQALGKSLPEAVALPVLAVAPARWTFVESVATDAVRAVYQGGQIRSDVLQDDTRAAGPRIERRVRQEIRPLRLTAAEARAATALAAYVARQPNLVVDEIKTARAREQAQSGVRDLYQHIKADTVLVKAGEIITDEKWAQLQAMNLIAPRLDAKTVLAQLALCLALVAFAGSYLLHFQRSLIERPAALWLAAMVPLAFVALFRQVPRVPHADFTMVPLAATAAMLLTILLNARVGLIAGFMVASMCAMMARTDMLLFIVAALSSGVGVLSISEIASRTQLMLRAPFILAVTTGGLAAVLGVLRGSPPEEILSLTFWGGGAGVFAVVATAALAMFLERPFGITTHLRLLELLAPDELVMRRMQAEAPGTYTHSLMVALMSEAAAKKVGADPLLCRVGALYHDIGKLRRPHCFVENQSGDNIHDRLSPQLSALIILAHVKDGVELGRALRLPQPVTDIIAQHHGSTLISYFYQRAVAQAVARVNGDGDDTANNSNALPDEASFRYAGPRPQTKEAAIILLADTIEASARSLPELTHDRLETHVKTMMAQRLSEGELSECELTLRDLGIIEATFLHVLKAVLHHRIEYPDPGRELTLPDREEMGGWMRDPFAPPAPAVHAPVATVSRRRLSRAQRRKLAEEKRQQAQRNGHEAPPEIHESTSPAPVPTIAANGATNGEKSSLPARQQDPISTEVNSARERGVDTTGPVGAAPPSPYTNGHNGHAHGGSAANGHHGWPANAPEAEPSVPSPVE